MKKRNWMAAGMMMLGMAGAHAAAAQEAAGPVANPVSTTVKGQLARYEKNMVAAAEAMPAEKYGFKPTPEMSTFGHVVLHVTQSNNLLCAKISGTAAPEVKVADTDAKEKLVGALKDSFAYCGTALAKADDAKLGEQVELFGGRKAPMAAAWIALSGGWNDHYGQEAVYLRLNGILPPTAQAAKK